jgi:hypothetical protein
MSLQGCQAGDVRVRWQEDTMPGADRTRARPAATCPQASGDRLSPMRATPEDAGEAHAVEVAGAGDGGPAGSGGPPAKGGRDPLPSF